MKDTDDAAQAKLASIKSYVSTTGIAEAALMKMAKLGAVIDGWMTQANVTISAVQCWTSMEEFFGGRTLHHHEHDEQQPDSFGLRSRRPGHAQHVHAGAGERHAFRAARLEQQLRQPS